MTPQQTNIQRLAFNVTVPLRLPSVDLAVFNARQLNEACDAVENQHGSSRIILLPPVAGDQEFGIVAMEDGVIIDLAVIKRELVQALEAIC